MVGVALGVFHSAVTIFSFNYFSNNGQPIDHVDSIFHALVAPEPDHSTANRLWHQIDFPSKNSSQPSELFLNHWFMEILHKSMRASLKNNSEVNELKGTDSSNLHKEIAKFVHLSVNQENKGSFYSRILNDIQSYKIASDDSIFTLGKFVIMDKAENQNILMGVNEFVDEVATNKSLADMFRPVVWSVLRGKNSLLKNERFGNYLYIGEIPGKSSGGEKEVLLWSSPQFVNKGQALFSFNMSGDQTDSQTRFRLLQKMSSGKANELLFRVDESSRLNASTLSVTPVTASAQMMWKVELMRDVNSVRIVANENQAIVENQARNYVLCAPTGSEFEIDGLRRKAVMLEFPGGFEAESTPTECLWNVIEV